MHEMDLRKVDLNLLVTLEALLEERSVTRAAERLGMSQPAASRALGRLRAVFADTLLVEGRRGYTLSPRAEEIAPTLRRLLAGVGDMLEASPFDPSSARGIIRLLMPDHETAALAPPLLARFGVEAPAVDLEILPPTGSLFDMLENDAAEALIGVFDDAPAGIRRRSLYDDRYVTLMRTGHPAAERTLGLKRYLELGHIVVSITGAGKASVDEALARIGRNRRVQVRVPSFFAAVEIAAQSDLIITLPASLANAAVATGRLVALPPPLDLERFTMSLLWHARHQDDPRHIWLRSAVVTAAKALQSRHQA